MSEKEKTKISVCYAGTQTFHLWGKLLGSKPNQFCEFYSSIPRSHTAKHFYLTCSVRAKKQRTVEFIIEAARSSVGNNMCWERLSLVLVVVLLFFILAKTES